MHCWDKKQKSSQQIKETMINLFLHGYIILKKQNENLNSKLCSLTRKSKLVLKLIISERRITWKKERWIFKVEQTTKSEIHVTYPNDLIKNIY